jgi:hypothetical protein
MKIRLIYYIDNITLIFYASFIASMNLRIVKGNAKS